MFDSERDKRGWRIDRLPGKPVRKVEDGPAFTFELPLWLLKDGRHMADPVLKLSLTEAEQLHAELCRALPDFGDPSVPTAACRTGAQRTVHH